MVLCEFTLLLAEAEAFRRLKEQLAPLIEEIADEMMETAEECDGA